MERRVVMVDRRFLVLKCGRFRGFSLLELLVVVAIISILMAFYMSTLGKARQKALNVVQAEGLRQRHIGRMADNANSGGMTYPEPPDREACRAAYRQIIALSEGDSAITVPLYVVRDDAEFGAYWHTLIDPEASEELDFQGNTLLAKDDAGEVYPLTPMPDDPMDLAEKGLLVPVVWEFLSTKPDEMTGDGFGINVGYSDGHVVHFRYPGEFPATRTVAELSHRFYAATVK